jgi:hypothetical protein
MVVAGKMNRSGGVPINDCMSSTSPKCVYNTTGILRNMNKSSSAGSVDEKLLSISSDIIVVLEHEKESEQMGTSDCSPEIKPNGIIVTLRGDLIRCLT